MGCVTNSEYIQAATKQADAIRKQAIADAAIQVGLALWQRKTSGDIINMQNEIADEQMKLAEAIQAHAEKFWPAEKSLVDDTFGETEATPNYVATAGTWGDLADQSMEDGRQDWIEVMRRACLSPTRCEDARFQRSQQLTRADMMSFAARQEEARTQAINDRRYERQYKVLGLAHGRLSNVVGFQSAALQAGGSASNMLTGAINSAMELYGYWPARNAPGPWGYASGIKSVFSRESYSAPSPVQREVISIERPALTPVPRFETGKAAGLGKDAGGTGWEGATAEEAAAIDAFIYPGNR